MPAKPKPRMGRPVTVGRGRATAARAITLRLSAAEDRARRRRVTDRIFERVVEEPL